MRGHKKLWIYEVIGRGHSRGNPDITIECTTFDQMLLVSMRLWALGYTKIKSRRVVQ